MFYILTYLKSWNYNTNVLVRIIVPCLNRCELLKNLKFYLLQKEILIWWFLLFCDRGLIGQIGWYSRDGTNVIFLRGKIQNTGN